jgi:ADP-ribose pyrophosphatase YjhB (NUDIX family)/catechol 2,3-dioxygenase-like lactoylglutathione lyase family enzyme
VLDDRGRVLLGRRAHDPDAGKWDILGGFAREDEHGLDGLRRELKEETGCDVEPLSFLGAFADRYGPGGNATLNFYWTARITAGDLHPADDVSELRWFAIDRLPPDEEIAFVNTRLALAELQRRLEARGVLGMFEIQLVVRGLEAMTVFYRDAIGLKVSLHDPDRGRTHFRLGRGQLILARAEGEEASPTWPGLPPPLLSAADQRGPTPARHGPVHFALEVSPEALVATGERLRSEGHDVRGPFRWPGGERSIYLRDPEANVVELIASRL